MLLGYRLRAYFTRHRGRLVLLWLAGLILAAVLVLLTINRMLDDILHNYAEIKTQAIIAQAVNQAVIDELGESEAAYTGMVAVQRQDNGQIAGIDTDVVRINLLKARVTQRVGALLEQAEYRNVRVPLGTLLGGNLFLGKGPGISLRLIPVGAATANLASQLTSAGINQTLHRIIMEVNVGITVMMPGAAVYYEKSEQVILAEMVIVGDVPESYTYLEPLFGGLAQNTHIAD